MPGGDTQTLNLRGGISGQVAGILSDFPTGGYRLQPNHRVWLDMHIVSILRRGGSLSVQGWASPLGSEEANQTLSRQRANAVVAYLRQQVQGQFRHLSVTGTGESFARETGAREGSNAAFYRGALVSAWPRPNPPPVPDPPRPAPVMTPRIVFRSWREVDVPPASSSDPLRPGEDDPFVQFGNWAIGQIASHAQGRQDDPPGREMTRARRQRSVNRTHRVTRIEVSEVTTFQSSLVRGMMRDTVSEVTYHWGPSTPQVEVTVTSRITGSGAGAASRAPRTRTRRIPRAQAEASSFFNPDLLSR